MHRETCAWHGREAASAEQKLVPLARAVAIALVAALAFAWLVHGGAPARPPEPPAVPPASAAPFGVLSSAATAGVTAA